MANDHDLLIGLNARQQEMAADIAEIKDELKNGRNSQAQIGRNKDAIGRNYKLAWFNFALLLGNAGLTLWKP